MRREVLGRFIKYERQKSKIEIDRLIRGVCNPATLRKIEAGERILDFYIVERLIERLGISVNKFDIFQDEKYYRFAVIREEIENLLEKEQYGDIEAKLDYYENLMEAQDFLHKQYLWQIRGVLASEYGNNHEEAKHLFEEALNFTVKNFSMERLAEYLMGEEEFILLLLYLREKDLSGEIRIKDYQTDLIQYIETVFKDNEVKVNIYSKVNWMIGESLFALGDYKVALETYLTGEKLLTENGLLLHLPSFLERILELSKRRKPHCYQKYYKMRNALKATYEEFEVCWNSKLKLWKKYRANGAFLISELIREKRIAKAISQENLAEHLEIDVKTISRIESGKARPKASTLKKISRFLGLNEDFSSTRIMTEDFELIELEREISRLLVCYKQEAAKILYKHLKTRLSKDSKENRQYLAFMDIVFKRRMGAKTDREFVEELLEAFSITRKECFSMLGEYVPKRVEAMILNNLAICYQNLGEVKKAIQILEKTVKGFEDSRVSQKLHYPSLSLLYANLAIFYEEDGRFQEGIFTSDKAISYALDCKRGEYIGELIQEKTYTLDRMQGYRSDSKEKYRQSYQIMKLMRVSNEKMTVLRKAFRAWYHEDIDINN